MYSGGSYTSFCLKKIKTSTCYQSSADLNPTGSLQTFRSRFAGGTEHSPVITHVEGVEALGEPLHVVGTHSLQEVYVVLGVEPAHVVLGCLVRLENLQDRKTRLISHSKLCLLWLQEVPG